MKRNWRNRLLPYFTTLYLSTFLVNRQETREEKSLEHSIFPKVAFLGNSISQSGLAFGGE